MLESSYGAAGGETAEREGAAWRTMLAAPLHSHDSQQWHQPVDTHVVSEHVEKRSAGRFDEKRYRPREQSVLQSHRERQNMQLKYFRVHSFQVPHGWMNDSIGPVFCKQTGFYHVLCQWNPLGTEWGNMSWAHAVSRDLVHWEPYGNQPALKPDQPYDREGVFTGCLIPSGPHGEEDLLTIIYTSVCDPNIHWTRDYVRGSETLSLATSQDGGRSWQKYTQNPLLDGPPKDLTATGWRDPQLATLPMVDRLLGTKSGEYFYGTLSGGLAGKTPTPFLYSIRKDNLKEWTPLGPLMDVGANTRLDEKWCPEFGHNFECSSLIEIAGKPLMLTSTEGGSRRWSIWLTGDLSLQDERPHLKPTCAGMLDWGSFYAASIGESKDGRKLVLGWLTEDDLTVAQRKSQGWAGMASLPREIDEIAYSGVTGALASPISRLRNFSHQQQPDGTFTLSTFSILPAQELLTLRHDAQVSQVADLPMYDAQAAASVPLGSQTWELEIEVDLFAACQSTTITVQHSEDEYTRIIFSLAEETVTIDREDSTLSHDVQTSPETGSHTLLLFGDRRETLKLRIFFDVSAIEVYANDRFAISSRVYPSSIGPMSLSISASAGRKSGSTEAIGRIIHSAVWQR